MVKTQYVYIGVAVVSLIVSNVFMINQNSSFEFEMLANYEGMIKSLRREFLRQQDLIESIHTDEIAWKKEQFDEALANERAKFHEQLSDAHGDIKAVRDAMLGIEQETKQYSEKVTYLKRENSDVEDHHSQIEDIAKKHIQELEDSLIECQKNNKNKETEIIKMTPS